MRERLKFRVWNGMEMILNVTVGMFGAFYVNPMSKGNGLDEKDSASLTPFNTRYSDATPVMQTTGLYDKHGVEMFAGDIVKAHGVIGVIEWVDELALFTVKVKLESGDGDMSIYSHQENGCNVEREVIGNIYQNPELLNY